MGEVVNGEIDKKLYLKASFVYYREIIERFKKLNPNIYEDFNNEINEVSALKINDKIIIEIIGKARGLVERMIKEKNPLEIIFPNWVNQVSEYINEVIF